MECTAVNSTPTQATFISKPDTIFATNSKEKRAEKTRPEPEPEPKPSP